MLFYKERIEILKEKNGVTKKSSDTSKKFNYPIAGRFGKNILSSSVRSINLNESVAMSVVIPNNSRILVEIKGPAFTHISDTEGSWNFSLSKKVNWSVDTYESDNGGRQEFVAGSGEADMELEFARSGIVSIVAYEGEDKEKSWEKTINVRR